MATPHHVVLARAGLVGTRCVSSMLELIGNLPDMQAQHGTDRTIFTTSEIPAEVRI